MEPDYRLKLDVFEGPFDLLLYLVKKNELDIYDIPITKITDQYLDFLEIMRQQGIDIASEWLVMAATLVQIKSRMLLPLEEDRGDELDEEELDPRLELVEKLIEYRKYREVAQQLERVQEREIDVFNRSVRELEEDEPLIEVDLFDLVSAFKNVLEYATQLPVTEIAREEFTVEEKIEEVQERLNAQGVLRWTEIFAEGRSLLEMVCIFLAILELIRLKRARVRQSKEFGDIYVFSTKEK